MQNFLERMVNVILLYEMYSEEFEIKDGSISKGYIDEEYCLSDIMPDCAIHLSRLAEKKLIYEALEQGSTNVFLHATEEHIHGLEVGNTYTVFVEQNEEFLKRDQAAMALRAQSMDGAVDPNAPKPLPKDDGRLVNHAVVYMVIRVQTNMAARIGIIDMQLRQRMVGRVSKCCMRTIIDTETAMCYCVS